MSCNCIKKDDLNVLFKDYLAKRNIEGEDVGKEEYYMLLRFLKFMKNDN